MVYRGIKAYTFAIPILTASGLLEDFSDSSQNKDRKCFRITVLSSCNLSLFPNLFDLRYTVQLNLNFTDTRVYY